MTNNFADRETHGVAIGKERTAQIAAGLQKRAALGGAPVLVGVFASNDVRAVTPQARSQLRCLGWRPLVVGAA